MASSTTDAHAEALPKNREAEQVAIGAMLVEPQNVVPQIRDDCRLEPQHFYWRAHREIVATVYALYDDPDEVVELITVANQLEERGVLPDVGGRAYLGELTTTMMTTTSAAYYAKIVRRKSMLRSLTDLGTEIQEQALRQKLEPDEIGASVSHRLEEIEAGHAGREEIQTTGQLVDTYLDSLTDPDSQINHRMTTGYRDLDRALQGFYTTGALHFVIARPKTGKSLFMGNAMIRQTMAGHRPGGILLEMSATEWLTRDVKQLGGIPDDEWVAPTDETQTKIERAAERLRALDVPLYSRSVLLDDVLAAIRELYLKYGCDAIWLDHFHELVDKRHWGPNARQKYEAFLDEIKEAVKGLYEREGRPLSLILLCQLSRAPLARRNPTPREDDIRETGVAEQKAHMILGLHRREMYPQRYDDLDAHQGIMETHVLKNRDGQDGTRLDRHPIRLAFYPEKKVVSDLARENEEEVPF